MRSRFVARIAGFMVVSICVLSACAGDGDGDDAVVQAALDQTSTPPSVEDDTTTQAPTTTAEPTTTTAPPPPDLELVEFGEYPVGVTTVTISEDSDRPLTVDIWFPLESSADRLAHEYTFFPSIFYRSTSAFSAELEDVSAAGPFPLIVYSHGSGGQRFIHSNYTEMLASHGHIVIAADHTGNTLIESLTGAGGDAVSSAEARPGDIKVLLDAALASEGSSTVLSAALTPVLTDDPVVITGHSLGGFASYSSIAGLTTDNVDIEGDDRIGATITLAPFATEAVLPDELLGRVDVPQLIIVGTDDKTTPIDPNVERLWELTAGSPTYRVELAEAEHLTFTDLCDYVTFLPELGSVPDFITTELETRSEAGCAPDDMPIERAQALTNTFAVRFLDEFYNGAAFIDPAAETLPDDITFEER